MRLSSVRLSLALLLPLSVAAQSLADFEKKVTEFTLSNGMHFLILERHDAPVVSFNSYVNAGSVDDPRGQTGIAHMFEHEAFKGTPEIGSRNWPAEKKALDQIEAVYDRLTNERSKSKPDAAKVKALQSELEKAIETAQSFVEPNEYDRIVEQNGGVGLNAGTGEDATNYYYGFPSNRLELWFLLESQRFLHPVLREFYKERDVVREERRMSIESNPQGRLVEALLSTAYAAHPYRVMAGGWASDIENFRRTEAEAFYKKHYTAANITIGIAGDVDPKEARRLAEKYFGLIPPGPVPPPVRTVEPPQYGEKRVAVESPSQPFLAIAYKRPAQTDPDDAALDVLSEILAGGRTALLYKSLVRDKQIALGAFSESTFPGGKYPALFLFFVVPGAGKTVDENEKACYEIIEQLKKEKVDQAALDRVKTKLRAQLIRKLDNNSGMAAELTSYYVAYGDWRKMFTALDDINKVTADDVMRVARKYLTQQSRTVAYTVAPAKGGAQ